jgi:hypothetical protein
MANLNDPFGYKKAIRELQKSFGGKRTKRRRHTESTFMRGAVSSEVLRAVKELRAKGEHVLTAAKVALKKGVDIIVEDAKSRCPVKTGTLKESIKAIDLKSEREKSQFATEDEKEEGVAYALTADAKNDKKIAYAQFVEFDPRIAKPFLYPALDAHTDEVNDMVKAAVDDAVRKAAK